MHKQNAKMIFFILLTIFLTACTGPLQNLQPPNVTLSNVTTAREMTVFEQRYDLTLRIQNPNNVALPVSGLSYTVTLNEKEFARGVSNEHTNIPALSEGLVHVTVTSGALDWLRQIEQIQTKPDLNPSYSITGTLYLEGFPGGSLPFSKAGAFTPTR